MQVFHHATPANGSAMLTAKLTMLRFFKPRPWDISVVAPPWGERKALRDFITGTVAAARGSTADLPDEIDAGGIRFIAGAKDSILGHADGAAETTAGIVLAAIKALSAKSSSDRAAALYSALTRYPAIDYVDALLSTLAQDKASQDPHVAMIARWLATNAPDREPVKIAIAILGVTSADQDLALLRTLGKHEEFTLYAAVAMSHSSPDPEADMWQLAQEVRGWGRIQIIQRLADTKNSRIREWLIRDGSRNDIMDEYTALICARTGNLIGALRQTDVDAALIKGAGAILAALITGGPAESIEEYSDGAEAAERYLRHLDVRDADLEDIQFVRTIETFVDEGAEAGSYQSQWQSRSTAIVALANRIKKRPDWITRINQGLASENNAEFWRATNAAKIFGIDPWDAQFRRLTSGHDEWYSVMQTDDPVRIDRVIELALARLPLDDIATGPADELGLGLTFVPHNALGSVVQELKRFPGKGWLLMRAALRSPVTRNRNMALRALAAWDRNAWPPDAEMMLRKAAKAEPNSQTRTELKKLLAGEPLSDV
jgi:hypothetical protein